MQPYYGWWKGSNIMNQYWSLQETDVHQMMEQKCIPIQICRICQSIACPTPELNLQELNLNSTPEPAKTKKN
jgi:hypothetical protein